MKRWSKSKSPVTKKLKLRTTLMADWWHARIPCGIANLAMHGYFCLVIIVIRVQVSNHPGIRTMRMRTVTINGRMFPLYKYQEWITPGSGRIEILSHRSYVMHWIELKQAQRRAAAGRSRHKSHDVIHTRGCIFPHDAQNEFSLFPSF